MDNFLRPISIEERPHRNSVSLRRSGAAVKPIHELSGGNRGRETQSKPQVARGRQVSDMAAGTSRIIRYVLFAFFVGSGSSWPHGVANPA